jgi:methylmalonyl-CoA mutase C-terminal domain/subunit
MQRKIRVLVGKPGLDGHDRGAKVVAAALRDAGMEVIYTGLHQTPEQVVEAAVQEDVDVVALSVLSGAHMTLFPEINDLMRTRGIGDRLLTGGGIIPNDDMTALAKQGVGRLFGPGTNTQDIVAYIREWYAGVHGAASLPPLPPPPVRAEPATAAVERPVPRPAAPARAAKPTVKPRATSGAKPRAAAGAKPRVKPAQKRASANGKAPARAKAARKVKPARVKPGRSSAKTAARSVGRKRG